MFLRKGYIWGVDPIAHSHITLAASGRTAEMARSLVRQPKLAIPVLDWSLSNTGWLKTFSTLFLATFRGMPTANAER